MSPNLSLFILGFLLAGFFTLLLKNLSLKHKILIYQDIPLTGGVAIWLAFTLASITGLLFTRSICSQPGAIIVASLIMLVFGIIDDKHELSIPAKFFVQILTVSMLIYLGVKTQIVYIGEPTNIIITFIWFLAIINAFNHLDVIDGLATGTAFIVSVAFFIISLIHQDIVTAILALSLAGSASGFLIHNLPPAKVYMGNSGSHFLGFALASIALLVSYAPLERKIALLSPIIILGLPIFDTAFLILMRLVKNHLPFNKSNDHLALRLLALGYSKKKALLAMLSLCLAYSFAGISITQLPNPLGIAVIASVLLVSLIITYRMNKVSV